MKHLTILLMFVLLTSCGIGMVNTKALDSEGKTIIELESKSDARVVYKKGDESFEVDNRGRPSLVEQVLVGVPATVIKGSQVK